MYAKYTVELRSLLDNAEMNAKINTALSTYPLYQPKKVYDGIPTREQLNTRLLNNYKYREIGFESVGRFLDELEIAMCEIMPLYNERFKTIEIMADLPNPFDNVDVVEEYTEERSAQSSGTTDTENNSSSTIKTDTSSESEMENEVNTTTGATSKTVNSGTPQDQISITADNIDGVSYADNVNWDKKDSSDVSLSGGSTNESAHSESESSNEGTSKSTGSSEESSSVQHTFTKKGNQGVNTYAHDMNEFRTSIIDVVNEIINDRRIQELFMLVY